MRLPVLTTLCSCLLLSAAPVPALALIEEHIGPAPKAFMQPGWPAGLAPLLRHESRVYSRWVNGNNDFYFDADLPQLKQLINNYAAMRLRDHSVYLRQGTPVTKSLKDQAFSYTAHLKLLEGIALWHVRTTSDDAVTLEPELTIYVSGEADRIALEEFDWPDHLVLDSDVEGLKLPAGRQRPARKMLHTIVQFDNGKPAVDFEANLSTKVTLWEKDRTAGIALGDIRHDSTFSVAFSKDELQQLNDGQLWLTLTVGNFAVRPSATDSRLNISSFRLKPDNVIPVQIAQPSWYHGQLLFDDGSPPIMDPKPWPGAGIRISFPFGAFVEPDGEGRFRLFLTADQLSELKERKPRKNIYVPLYGTRGRSRATHVFPADQLATSPELVRPVRIPRPVPPASPDN